MLNVYKAVRFPGPINMFYAVNWLRGITLINEFAACIAARIKGARRRSPRENVRP